MKPLEKGIRVLRILPRLRRAVPLPAILLLLAVIFACAAPVRETKETKKSQNRAKPAAAAKSDEDAPYSRTHISKRVAEIEGPDWGEYEEDQPPPKEVAKAEEPASKDPVQEEPAPVREQPAEEAVETPEKAVALEEPPPLPPEEDQAKPADPFGASSWEQDFINDMEHIKDRKEGRSRLTEDLVQVFPLQDEIMMGEGICARVLAQTPEFEDGEIWEYVSFVGMSLAEVCKRNDLVFYFVVLDNLEEINAFAAPGGYVFITSGALRLCRNEAELASILAHEVGHIVHRHGIQMLDLSAWNLMSRDMVSEMDESFERSEFYDLKTSMDPRYQKIEAELSELADQLFQQMLNPYSQNMEFEADAEGFRIMAEAGYNPYAALSLLERLREQTGEIPAYERALHSHPPTQERIEGLKKIARQSRLPNQGDLREDRFNRYISRLADR